MLLSALVSKLITALKPVRSRCMGRARIGLEILESRFALDANTWIGIVSDNWNEPLNWVEAEVPTQANPARLQWLIGTTLFAPRVRANDELAVGSLLVDASFQGRALTIDGVLAVGNTPQGGENFESIWDVNANIVGSGGLAIRNSLFRWANGSIANDSVFVYGNGHLRVQEQGGTVSVSNLVVGKDWLGNHSTGLMTVGGTGIEGLTADLITATGMVITISDTGTLDLAQDNNCDTSGGIVGGARIDNEGIIRRFVVSQDGESLTVSTRIRNLAPSSQFLTGANTKLTVSRLDQIDGVAILGASSELTITTRVIVSGGIFETTSQFDSSSVTELRGNLDLIGGKLIVGNGAHYVGLQITGDLTLGGNPTIEMNVEGQVLGGYDQIWISGNLVVTDPAAPILLRVATDAATPPAGWYRDIITWGGSGPEAGTDFAFDEWVGDFSPPGGYAINQVVAGGMYRIGIPLPPGGVRN